MKTLILTLYISTLLLNCSNSDDSCEWKLIEPVFISNDINGDLINDIFSENNDKLNDIDRNLLIINNEQELSEIYDGENNLGINFEKYFLIGGKFQTSSISNEILNEALFKRDYNSTYKYEITVKQCSECFTAIGNLYYWKIYTSMLNNENIELTIK
ncbi:hypothetical protein [Yeosuana sp.]|uniref:hypothetical protein n=1 Tax=Yeosuana sp. TaxID=2529388 RepID=UPI004055128B